MFTVGVSRFQSMGRPEEEEDDDNTSALYPMNKTSSCSPIASSNSAPHLPDVTKTQSTCNTVRKRNKGKGAGAGKPGSNVSSPRSSSSTRGQSICGDFTQRYTLL